MKIIFRKISAYVVPKSSQGVANLLMGKLDPPTLNCRPRKTVRPTLCSTALRAKMSIAGPKVKYTQLLDEVRFDPVTILRLKSPRVSSTQVRKAFVAGWINDQLAEPCPKIIRNIAIILHQAGQHSDSLVVSHTFKLTLIRAYLTEGEGLLSNPDLICKYIQPKTKLMDFNQEFYYSD